MHLFPTLWLHTQFSASGREPCSRNFNCLRVKNISLIWHWATEPSHINIYENSFNSPVWTPCYLNNLNKQLWELCSTLSFSLPLYLSSLPAGDWAWLRWSAADILGRIAHARHIGPEHVTSSHQQTIGDRDALFVGAWQSPGPFSFFCWR